MIREFVINNMLFGRESLYEGISEQVIKCKKVSFNAFSVLSKFIIISTLLMIYGHGVEVRAAQNYVMQEREKIHAIVSNAFVNRINFEVTPITNIIGDEEKYQVITDESHLNLFLRPSVEIGESIELSLTNSGGKVINLVLHVKEGEGQLIFIKDQEDQELLNKRQEKEIAELIKAMIRDKNSKDKYFISKINRKIPLTNSYQDGSALAALFKNYQIIQDRTYSYQDLIGARLEVINKDAKEYLELKREDFEKIFGQTLAVPIEHDVLSPYAGRRKNSRSMSNKHNIGYVFIVARKRG